MIWVTWRQFRTQTWLTVGALAAIGVALLITSRSITDAYNAAGIAACQGDCTAAIDSFLRQVRGGASGTVYDVAMLTVYVLPAVIGVFWGAPLIARELETGTHRLAWNQSVTRTRWLATKLAIIGAAAVATVGLLTWAITSWAQRIDDATGDLITPGNYGARGIVPIGYALFAFTLGVTLGMLIRRTVPAMAATLGVTIASVFSMEEWVRAHLVAASQSIQPLDLSTFDALMIDQNSQVTVLGSENVPGAWILSNQTITPTGKVFSATADLEVCGMDALPNACEEWLGTLGLRQELTYHPADHFWSLQWVEAGIFVGVALLLTAFCFWWTRRRLT